jgi:exonuclease SbcC
MAQFKHEEASQKADKSRLATIGCDQEKAERIVAEFLKLKASLPHLTAKREKCEEAYAIAQTALSEIEQRIEKWMQNANTVEKHRHDRDLYGEIALAMSELRSKLNSLIRPTLATFAGEALTMITDSRYTRVDIDESFNARLFDGDLVKNVISGGEEDVLSLALRVALSRYVQEKSGHPLAMLILDEVFGSLDPDRRTNVVEWLGGLKAMFPQIIWISHVDGLTEHADRVLRVKFNPTTRSSVVENYYGEAFSI